MSQPPAPVLSIRIRSGGEINKYPAKAHARRVAEALKRDRGLLLINAAGKEAYPGSDNAIPFRQDRYFYYLTGCNEPGCSVYYSISRDRLTLLLPPIDKSRIVWFGRGSTVEEALQKYDVDHAEYLDASLGSPEQQGRLATDDLLTLDNEAIRRAFDSCRTIKDEYEIRLIRTANEITAAAHINVAKNLHAFRNEAQVEAAYMQACIERRAKEQAYAPIAGSGVNGATLHYMANLDDFGEGQTLVLDAGCEVSCYASDVTRTFPLNEQKPGYWPSEEARNVYHLVAKVQESCIDQLRPGALFIDITHHAQDLFVDGLLQLGILKGKKTDILKAGTVSAFFPHGLGHHLGLEVHDVSPYPHPPLSAFVDHCTQLPKYIWQSCGAWSVPRSSMSLEDQAPNACAALAPKYVPGPLDASTLAANMVVTVEPGLYFNKFLLEELYLNNPVHRKFIQTDVLSRYVPVGGVRIEDDILITKNGYENLTTTPKGDDMLKIIRKSAK